MKSTRALFCLAAILLLPVQLRAQSSVNPVSDALRASTGRLARNIIAAIDDFPVAKFQYKPTPAQMSVAQIALHLADDNDFGCASLGGNKVAESPKLQPTDDVSRIVARMKESFDACRNAIQPLNDKQMGDMVPWFTPGKTATRAAMALEMQEDWADHYSQLANYMRLNGILPPTARKRGN